VSAAAPVSTPGIDRSGLAKATEVAVSERRAAALAGPSASAASRPMPRVLWVAYAVAVVVCLFLLGSLIARLGEEGGPHEEESAQIVRGSGEGPGEPPDEIPPVVPPVDPPVEPPVDPPVEPPVGPPERPLPPDAGPVEGLPDPAVAPGEGGPPVILDGADPAHVAGTAEGSWLLVFGPASDPEDAETIRAADELHRRLRGGAARVLLVVPRASFEESPGVLASPEAIRARLRTFGAASDLPVLLDPAAEGKYGTRLRTALKVRREVAALLLRSGREEQRTSTPEGVFTVPTLSEIARAAIR
jgi:hypothetical protein